jgi:hypothetical protein
MSETLVSIRPSPVHAVRWAAVLAGMAVGIAIQLVLVLGGAALGFGLYESGRPVEPLPVAAALWSVAAMLTAALIGGYVAARASGLRRLADGVLHGAVSWGATTVLFALLTTTALGATLSGLFGLVVTQRPAAIETRGAVSTPLALAVVDALNSGDRTSAVRRLQEQTGINAEEAGRYIDLGALLAGLPPADRAGARSTAAAALASRWLVVAIALSLFAGVVGGGVGARGTRRLLKGARFVEARATRPGGFIEPAA